MESLDEEEAPAFPAFPNVSMDVLAAADPNPSSDEEEEDEWNMWEEEEEEAVGVVPPAATSPPRGPLTFEDRGDLEALYPNTPAIFAPPRTWYAAPAHRATSPETERPFPRHLFRLDDAALRVLARSVSQQLQGPDPPAAAAAVAALQEAGPDLLVRVLRWLARMRLYAPLFRLLTDTDVLAWLAAAPSIRKQVMGCCDWVLTRAVRSGLLPRRRDLTATSTSTIWGRVVPDLQAQLRALSVEAGHDTHRPVLRALLTKCEHIGDLFLELGWAFGACDVYTVAVAAASALSACSATPPSRLWNLLRLRGVSAMSHAEYADADRFFSRAATLSDQIGPEAAGEAWYDKAHARRGLLASHLGELRYLKCEYAEAWRLFTSTLAAGMEDFRATDVISILHKASRVAIVHRQTAMAERLILSALELAERVLGADHHGYAAVLQSYAHYKLNIDKTTAATRLYWRAMEVMKKTFADYSLHHAMLCEDLAYSLYVEYYSQGRFESALSSVNKSLDIRNVLLPRNHVHHACSNRVKALIIEEMALMHHDPQRAMLLDAALALHLQGLELSRRVFGENNLTTAKYYGNLGRLYQTRENFEQSELHHLKAIEIKERILDSNDYEVALSIGHLASLYTYDMAKLAEAEPLYLRSVKIGLELFGPTYSGLEYDYRGLREVYSKLNRAPEYQAYCTKLQEWTRMRTEAQEQEAVLIPERQTGSDSAIIAEIARLNTAAPTANAGTSAEGDASPDAATAEVAVTGDAGTS